MNVNIILDDNRALKSNSPGEKFMTMRKKGATKEDGGLQTLSPFLLEAVLTNLVGSDGIKMAKKLRNGQILIHTRGITEARKLAKMKAFCSDYEIIIEEHEKLNQTKGVIFCHEFKWMSEKEILEGLATQHVTSIFRLKAKQAANRQNNDEYSGLCFITFNCSELPEHIKVGYEIIPVKPYIPNPIRCYKCLQFEHTKDKCPAEEAKCGQCGEKEHITKEERSKGVKCSKEPVCIVCKTKDHATMNRQCPTFKFQKELMAIRFYEKVSPIEARKIYLQRFPMNGKSFADAVREPRRADRNFNSDWGNRPPSNMDGNGRKRTNEGRSGESPKSKLTPKKTPNEENFINSDSETENSEINMAMEGAHSVGERSDFNMSLEDRITYERRQKLRNRSSEDQNKRDHYTKFSSQKKTNKKSSK
jgi:hypothetical protein